MALVERLMRLNDDGTAVGDAFPPGHPGRVPVHAFFAALGEIIAGALTVAQVQAIFAMRATVDASGKSDNQDAAAIAAAAPSAANQAGRALYIERVHGVFILAEARIAGYATPAQVRAKLGI